MDELDGDTASVGWIRFGRRREERNSRPKSFPAGGQRARPNLGDEAGVERNGLDEPSLDLRQKLVEAKLLNDLERRR
jgi:hypothetical protein